MEGPDRPYLTKAQRRDLEWPRQEKTRGRVHADKVKVVFYGRLIASTRWLEEKHPTSSDLIEVFHCALPDAAPRDSTRGYGCKSEHMTRRAVATADAVWPPDQLPEHPDRIGA